MAHFRFQDLEIWKLASILGDEFFEVADLLEEKKLFKFADQTRAVGMSMSNNIAEGSGSDSNAQFIRYLNISRGSVFEAANITLVLHRRRLVSDQLKDKLLEDCDKLARKLTAYKRYLA